MLLTESLLGTSSTAANYIEDVFSTYLYTGTGANQTISNGVDLSTYGGMVWIKSRSTAANGGIFDTARGANKRIQTDDTGAQVTDTNGLNSYATNGFNLGTGANEGKTNTSGVSYASWTFREQSKFFDIVTYTGNGTTQAISHNLGSTPGCIIVKSTSAVNDWRVYHRSLATADSALRLNSTAAAGSSSTFWNSTAPTSTQFTVGSDGSVNASGATYVAYLFAHDAGGFGAAGTGNVISCGAFTTNASGIATVTLGYEPQWVLIKRSSSTGAWHMLDTMRGFSNSNDAWLMADSSAAENSTYAIATPTATGFVTDGTSVIDPSSTFIYIAIRRGPMKTPTSGTSVFALQAYSDGVGGAALAGSTQSFVNLRPDLSVFANRAGSTNNFQFADLLRGYQQTTGPGADTLTTPTLKTTNSNAEATSGNAIYVLPANGSNPPEVRFSSDSVGAKLGYIFRRAPGFFDVVCYTGTGVARTVSHNLGVAPELIIVKCRGDAFGWAVYSSAVGNTAALFLETTAAPDTNIAYWNNTTPTGTVFSVGNANRTNRISLGLVAYLFATCPGVSKVFSYTGNGSSQTINCGFTGGARFVLIKRTDSTGDWYVWDSARGIVAANDPHLSLNSTAAEVTTDDSVDTDSSGFIVNQLAATNINVNAATYIGLAIA